MPPLIKHQTQPQLIYTLFPPLLTLSTDSLTQQAHRNTTIAIAKTPPKLSALLALNAADPDVALLPDAEVVVEAPEPGEPVEPDVPDVLVVLVVLDVPDVPLVEPLTEVASPGRLTVAFAARAWNAARVLFDEALKVR
jgi:hypothetical protein